MSDNWDAEIAWQARYDARRLRRERINSWLSWASLACNTVTLICLVILLWRRFMA